MIRNDSLSHPGPGNLCSLMANVNCPLLFISLLVWTLFLAYLIAVIIQLVVWGTTSWRRIPLRLWALLVRRELYIVSLHDFATGECIIAGAFPSQTDATNAIDQILENDFEGRDLWDNDLKHCVLDNTDLGLLIKLPQGHEHFSGVMAAVHNMRFRDGVQDTW